MGGLGEGWRGSVSPTLPALKLNRPRPPESTPLTSAEFSSYDGEGLRGKGSGEGGEGERKKRIPV